MKKLLITSILACSLLCLLSASQAADKPTEETPPKTKAASRLPFHGTISAIDKTAKTIALEEKGKSRTFQVTSATRIHKDAKPAARFRPAASRQVLVVSSLPFSGIQLPHWFARDLNERSWRRAGESVLGHRRAISLGTRPSEPHTAPQKPPS